MPAIQYRNKDGKKLKGVTTILSLLAKPAIIWWGYQQGMENFNFVCEAASKFETMDEFKGFIQKFQPMGLYDKRDKAADAGTLAHQFVENHLKGLADPSTAGVADDVKKKAENCYIAFLDWEKAHSFKMVESEKSLVSEEYQYGGTIDIGAIVNELGIVDIKTSKDIYFSMWIQVAAYGKLWDANYPDNPVNGYHILRLGAEGDFGHEYRPNLDKEFEVFKSLLTIQRIMDETKQKL